MARNGTGTYVLPAGQPVVTGTVISSTTHNTLMTDLAAALTTSIATDGQTVPTANLPMGGFKLTGLGAGNSPGDSVRFEQLVATSVVNTPAGNIAATTVQAALNELDTEKAPAAGSSSIISVGTVLVGTWHADTLAGQYGGTGIVNTGKSITLGGNLTTSGAFATTLTATGTTSITLPTSGTLATLAGGEELTNKRVTARVGTAASSATPTINTDTVDTYHLTAQAVDITSMTTNLTGTPTIDQVLIIKITGTAARAITWGASFESSTILLPTTTVTTNMLTVGFLWNDATSKWRCVASC